MGADFVSCIELIEHIDPWEHAGIVKSIFGIIRPLTAVITTPNGEFNAHWPTMPHGEFRHADHRFEWSRDEFRAFVENILAQYPEYEAEFDGIGVHWGGDESKGFCSQAAIFRMTGEAARKGRKVLELDKEQVDEIMDEEQIAFDSAELTYERAFSFRLDAYDFADKLYKAVMRSLDPFLGIATQNNNFIKLVEDDQYEYNKVLAGVHHSAPNFYNKPGLYIGECRNIYGKILTSQKIHGLTVLL